MASQVRQQIITQMQQKNVSVQGLAYLIALGMDRLDPSCEARNFRGLSIEKAKESNQKRNMKRAAKREAKRALE
jgi:hypothetical protein